MARGFLKRRKLFRVRVCSAFLGNRIFHSALSCISDIKSRSGAKILNLEIEKNDIYFFRDPIGTHNTSKLNHAPSNSSIVILMYIV